MSDKPTKAAPQPQQALEPTILFRDQMQIRIDRFKLQLANMKKNLSWDKKQPNIVEVEHTHFFISKDESGTPQKYCTPIGGHFHELISLKPERVTQEVLNETTGKLEIQEDVILVAKFGPALRHEYIKRSDGSTKKVIRPVAFNVVVEDEDHGEVKDKLPDGHTHEAVYLHSEMFDMQKKRAIQSNNASFHGQTAPAMSTAQSGQTPAGFQLKGSSVA